MAGDDIAPLRPALHVCITTKKKKKGHVGAASHGYRIFQWVRAHLFEIKKKKSNRKSYWPLFTALQKYVYDTDCTMTVTDHWRTYDIRQPANAVATGLASVTSFCDKSHF
jgi:hypothetical protein